MQTRDLSEPLEAIRAEILVFFHVEDEPAPRARLGRLDWILLGGLSRLRATGRFTGGWGASALLSPGPKLKAERVLVMGVGRRADLSMNALYRLSYQTAQTVLNLGCRHITVDLPFRLFPHEAPENIRRAFLEGFTAELTRGHPDVEFSVSTLPPTHAG